MSKEKILVSACLLGVNCRYDGKSKPNELVKALKDQYELIPVCPEVFGGLKIPHEASEIFGDKVISKSNIDLTLNFQNGAEKTLKKAVENGVELAILKEKSPSCGKYKIYDGTFSGNLINGSGIASRLLQENGIKVYNEDEIDILTKG